MKKWIWSLLTAVLLAVAVVEIGTVTQVSAATEKTGTTADGFSYKILSKDGTIEITKYKGKKKKLVIPDKIDGKKVTQIGELILLGNKYVVSLEIPDSVKKIHENSFSFCKSLKSIKVGKNVEQLGEYDCLAVSNVESFDVSAKNRTYYSREGVLFKREKKEKILVQYPTGKKETFFEVPEDTTIINIRGISGDYLSTLIIPSGVKELIGNDDGELVGYSSWAGCTEIIVDEDNEYFYSKDGVLFDNENRLLIYPRKKSDTRYEVPDGTTLITSRSFMRSQYIEEIIIPDSVKWIGDSAFKMSPNLKSVDIATGIGEEAFWECEKLVHVTFREGVDIIQEQAFLGTALENVVLPESLKELESRAIAPENLKSLEIRSKNCSIEGSQGTVNKTVIYGYADSTAEKFAKEYGYQFKLIGSEETPGEDNSEGTITKNTIKLSKSTYTYDGKTKKPEVIVKDKFGNKIKKDCYKVSYKNNKNVGIATVKIQLERGYSGTIKTTFMIKPPKSSITKITVAEKGFQIQWKGVKPSQINGYEIQYSENKKFDTENSKKVIVNQRDAAKKKIGNLNAKQNYYVRIRSYKAVAKDGKTERIYSKWSDVKKVKTL